MAVVDPSAFYISKSIEELKQVAEQEVAHGSRLQPIADTWNAITSQILQPAIQGLDIGIQKVQAQWQDNTYATAFEAPAMGAMKSLQHSKDVIESANVPGEIAELQTGIANAKTAFDAAYAEYQEAAKPIHTVHYVYTPTEADLEPYRMKAVAAIVRMDQAFAIAGAQIAMAAQGHVWNGPRAAGAPTPAAPGPTSAPDPSSPQSEPTSPGAGGPPAEQPTGQQPSGEQPAGQPPGGGQPPGQQPAGQPAGGDTGLAGGTAPPPTLPNTPVPTPPPGPTPTPTPPPGPVPGPIPGPKLPGPTSPGGGVPVGGGAPLAAAGGGARGVEQAGRNLTASPSAGRAASAPSLPAPSTGASSTQSPVGTGGVPPMMPPMAPQGAGNANRPRPGTAPAVGAGRSRPAGPTAGVPSSLRGRTGQGDAGTKATPVSRRTRRDGPQTVEILDSELWQVDEQSPAAAAERRTTRQPGTPRDSGSMSAS